MLETALRINLHERLVPRASTIFDTSSVCPRYVDTPTGHIDILAYGK